MFDSKHLRHVLAGFSVLLLAGPALGQITSTPAPPPIRTVRIPPPAPAPVPPPAPAPIAPPAAMLDQLPEGANLIIFREYAEPTIWAATVKVDGKKIAALGNENWTATTVTPGRHEVTISWSFLSGQSGGRYDVDVEEGRYHYLTVLGQSQYAGGVGSITYYRMGSGIAEVQPARAPAQILACCRFKEPND